MDLPCNVSVNYLSVINRSCMISTANWAIAYILLSCSDLPSDVSFYSVDLYNRNKRSKDVLVGMWGSYTVFILYQQLDVLSPVFFSPLATSEEFENEGFTLKTHQMFSVYTTPE